MTFLNYFLPILERLDFAIFSNLYLQGLNSLLMILQEENIREFQEIINGKCSTPSENSNNKEMEETENLKSKQKLKEKQKKDNQTIILFLTSAIGLFFLATILIWTLLYIYLSQGRASRNLNSKTPAQTLKVPGIEGLVMDPYPDQRIKVWALRTAVPPTAIIGDYSFYFPLSENENSLDL